MSKKKKNFKSHEPKSSSRDYVLVTRKKDNTHTLSKGIYSNVCVFGKASYAQTNKACSNAICTNKNAIASTFGRMSNAIGVGKGNLVKADNISSNAIALGKNSCATTSSDHSNSYTACDSGVTRANGMFSSAISCKGNSYATASSDYSCAITTGVSSTSATSSRNSVSVSLGIDSTAKAVDGFIVLSDWRTVNIDGLSQYVLNKVCAVRVGEKINDEVILPNIEYGFVDGKLIKKNIYN